MEQKIILEQLPIPEQYKGREIIAEQHRACEGREQYKQALRVAIGRLKDVNNWHKITGMKFAEFNLMDASGEHIMHVEPQVGMHFRVNISGPATSSGEGYDWVKIVQVEDFKEGDYEGSYITVQPSDNPTASDNHTAHFYDAASSSTFMVVGKYPELSALVIDRNVSVNKNNESLGDEVRNALFGGAGMVAFSKMQWQMLSDGLVAE
jgi:hypothetical protein